MQDMIRTIKENKKGEIEIEDNGNIEEYIALDKMEEAWNSDLCDEDGIPFDMLDEEGELKDE